MSSDIISFELAPQNVRFRVVGVFALSLAMQLVAIAWAPWFTAHVDGETFSVGLTTVSGHPELYTAPAGVLQILVLIVGFLLAIKYIVQLVYVGIIVFRGQPFVRRGLFKSKLRVAWKRLFRAHVHTAIVMVFGVTAALFVPQLLVHGTQQVIPAELTYSWGGILLVLGYVVAHVGIVMIKRDPLLAAPQTWAPPTSAMEPDPKPVRTSRPMIQSPLPPRPVGTGSDPFREPPPAASIESRLVRPALPTSVPKVAASDQPGDEPSLLR